MGQVEYWGWRNGYAKDSKDYFPRYFHIYIHMLKSQINCLCNAAITGTILGKFEDV